MLSVRPAWAGLAAICAALVVAGSGCAGSDAGEPRPTISPHSSANRTPLDVRALPGSWTPLASARIPRSICGSTEGWDTSADSATDGFLSLRILRFRGGTDAHSFVVAFSSGRCRLIGAAVAVTSFSHQRLDRFADEERWQVHLAGTDTDSTLILRRSAYVVIAILRTPTNTAPGKKPRGRAGPTRLLVRLAAAIARQLAPST